MELGEIFANLPILMVVRQLLLRRHMRRVIRQFAPQAMAAWKVRY
jgi:hypothetical protein